MNSPLAPKSDFHREPAKGRVHRAAIELFARRGFHGVGIRDIAKAAGLSTSALYNYMGTKTDLLIAIMETNQSRLLSAGNLAVAGLDDPALRVGSLVYVHVLTHALRPQETLVSDNELKSLDSAGYARVVGLRDTYEQLWAAAIDDGVAASEFAVEDVRLARFALLQMCTGVAHWFRPDGTESAADVASRYAGMSLNLLRAQRRYLPPARAEVCALIVKNAWDLSEHL